MKKHIFKIPLLFLLAACQPRQQHGSAAAPNKLLVIEVIDHSKSADFGQIDTGTTTGAARVLYNTIAVHGGGVLRLMGIYSRSDRQQFTTLNIDPLPDTTSAAQISNVYKRARALDQQRKTLDRFTKHAEEQISRYLAATNKPHNEQHSDIASVLSLLQTACNQQNFSTYKKYVLIESDMLNDPIGQDKRLRPVHLDNTTVIVVRPAISEDSIKKLFPDSDVYCVTDLADAIALIQ